jgi:glycine cleavage system aminomethyltransferase T
MKKSSLRPAHPAGTTYDTIGDAEVPWCFGDLAREYTALRTSAGLLDMSAVGLLGVEGPDAAGLVELVLTRDVAYMTPERSISGLVLDASGTPLDSVVVFKVEGGYLIETSVGRGAATLGHLIETAAPASMTVTVTDLSDRRSVLAVEGPDAWATGVSALGVEVNGLPFEGVMHVRWNEEDIMVSRTGYTSEFGFKVYATSATAIEIWQACATTAVPAGHEALEVAMLEVRQPRLHRELTRSSTVVTSGLNWLVDLESDFIGRDAVAAEAASGASRLTVGFSTTRRSPILTGGTVLAGDRRIGTVVDSVDHPVEDRLLGLAVVEQEFCASGLELAVESGDAVHQVRTLSSPYRVPTSWRAVRGQ